MTNSDFTHPKCECHQCTYLRANDADRMLIGTRQVFVPSQRESVCIRCFKPFDSSAYHPYMNCVCQVCAAKKDPLLDSQP